MQCLRKLEYYIRIKKEFKQKYQASEKYVNFYALNTWLASFCMNYCINVAWYGGNPPVSGPLVFPVSTRRC